MMVSEERREFLYVPAIPVSRTAPSLFLDRSRGHKRYAARLLWLDTDSRSTLVNYPTCNYTNAHS